MPKIPLNLQWLRSSWTVFFGALVGIYIGLYDTQYLSIVAPLGQFYLDVLTMCILPILLTAISLSIGRLLKQANSQWLLLRLSLVFFACLLGASTLGALAGAIFTPGSQLDTESLKAIGQIIQDFSNADLVVDLHTPYEAPPKQSMLQAFLFSLVPANIFSALSHGYTVKVLFFALLFGFAIGAIRQQASDHLCLSFEGIYAAFTKIVQWMMYLFPFGLCGLLASTLSKIGGEALVAMIKFVPVVILAFISWFLIVYALMCWRLKHWVMPFTALKEPMTISLGTANTMASLPSALKSMHEQFGYDKQSVDLLIPLTFNLCRIGPTLYFALATMFVIQIYNVDLTFGVFMVVVLGSLLAGTATAGSSGVSMLTMLSLVSGPLGLPLDAVLILFVVVDPIIAPFRVMAIVHSACAIVTWVLPKPAHPMQTPLVSTH
ncbi:dicarboxylate/amino acid:cation symporter [Pseudoalteromonas xiamenensis]